MASRLEATRNAATSASSKRRTFDRRRNPGSSPARQYLNTVSGETRKCAATSRVVMSTSGTPSNSQHQRLRQPEPWVTWYARATHAHDESVIDQLPLARLRIRIGESGPLRQEDA